MKRLIFYNTLATIALYTVVYLIKSFIVWGFTNPIQWIIDIPNYTEESRGLILFFYIIYQGIQLTGIYQTLASIYGEPKIPSNL